MKYIIGEIYNIILHYSYFLLFERNIIATLSTAYSPLVSSEGLFYGKPKFYIKKMYATNSSPVIFDISLNREIIL